MFEWIVFPAVVGVLALAPKGEKRLTDKKKIKVIAENLGIGISDKHGKFHYPKYKATYPIYDDNEELIGQKYFYTLPFGVPSAVIKKMEEGSKVFQDGLDKPVKVSFKNSRLYISVFNDELPTRFPYSELPSGDSWCVPMGKTLEGFKWHNFEHTPHIVMGGTTRFGKTVLLKVIMTYLIENHPDDVEFYIIDLKGGLEFIRYECLRQVKGVASNPIEAHNMLVDVLRAVEGRQEEFRKTFTTNIADSKIKKRTFIIIDEAAQLTPDKSLPKPEQKVLQNCQLMLSEISRIAGGLGFREIFCTQYPVADALPRQIKMNSDAKIALRVPTGYASDVIIDERGAENLPSDIRGRALFKTHELTEMQIPLLEDKEMWERLERYQEPVVWEGEAKNVIDQDEAPGEYLVLFGEDAIRDKATNSENS